MKKAAGTNTHQPSNLKEPWASGFHSETNECINALLRQWQKLICAYSERVRFRGSHTRHRQPDALFWHDEASLTSSLAAAAWQLEAVHQNGWAAATEVWCRRAWKSSKRECARNRGRPGRLDLLLQTPNGKAILIEAKRVYCKNGDLPADLRSRWASSASEQLQAAIDLGMGDAWRVGVLFLVPYWSERNQAMDGWADFENKVEDYQAAWCSASARIPKPAPWPYPVTVESNFHPGVGLLGFKQRKYPQVGL